MNIGYIMKCYYRVYSVEEYGNSLRYSFGFEGYINNLFGVFENLQSNIVSFATFDSSNCKMKKQYYPPLMDSSPVKNDCDLSKNAIISSPNAGGKTTMIKTTTMNIIFTQQLGCGFYSACSLKPYTHIHSYLNIPDTSGRDSLFQAESRRCKEIIDIISLYNDENQYRHFCIFDELYSGTNPVEATESAYAFILYLSKFKNVNFMLTTHYISICSKLKKCPDIQNYKMEVENLESGELKYTYKMKKGISRIQGAIAVLKQMDYPKEIIDSITNYSAK
jgi:DNA mismatch repair ATPase MutS